MILACIFIYNDKIIIRLIIHMVIRISQFNRSEVIDLVGFHSSVGYSVRLLTSSSGVQASLGAKLIEFRSEIIFCGLFFAK